MSETFFHLLGPGTQPNDDSFSMNPLPITCQVNDEPSMAALEQCAHSPQVIALLNELQHQLSERQPPLGEVLAVKSQRRRSSLYQYASRGRGSVSAHSAG